MFKRIQEVEYNWLRNNHQMIHYFGLGFIQLKIDDKHRLHFYDEDLPPIVPEEDIHNHRYNFTSRILKGEFEQSLFEVVDGDTHILEPETCQADKHADVEPKPCGIKLLNRSRYVAGSEYYLTADTFHRVKADYCITLVIREPKVKELADVVRDKNLEKICAFSKKLPVEDLWNTVKQMLS